MFSRRTIESSSDARTPSVQVTIPDAPPNAKQGACTKIPHSRHSGGELAPYYDTGPESIPGEVHRHNIGGCPSCCPSELGEGLGVYSAGFV